MKPKIIASLLLASTLVTSAFAQEPGTLEKIRKDGAVTLGVRESSVPFSYYDDKQHIVGYSADMCSLVVSAIKDRLHIPNLAVKEIPTTSQNRLPLIVNGTVDLECGSTTNNTDRQKQVAFSDTIFVIGTRLLTRKNSGIKNFSDLTGKNIVTTAGTTSEKILREMNYKNNLHMNVISAKDHSESFMTLESGRATAFMMDDALLYGQLARSTNAGNYEIVGKPQSFEAYGLVMRKNDPEFQGLVNQALVDAMKSGKAEALYKKWFMSPIPPKGINLNFPMTVEVREHFQNPSDKPYQ
nr:glutamate/aspartate ABC transporter substrate-binding protein [Burkholderia ambifaria]